MATIYQLDRILRKSGEEKLFKAQQQTKPYTQNVDGKKIKHFFNYNQREQVIKKLIIK